MSTRLSVAAAERTASSFPLDAVVLAALVPAAMLAVDPSGWYPFGPVKWALVSTLVLGGAALVLAARPVLVGIPPTAAAGLLVFWLAVAAASGADPLYAWIGTPERRFGIVAWALCFLAFVAGQALRAGRDLVMLVAGAVLAGAVLGPLGVAEAAGWEPAALDLGARLTSTFGSAAYLGAAVALLVPVVAGAALDRGVPRWIRRVAASSLVPLLVTAVGAGARAAWVGLLGAGLSVVVARWADLRRALVARRSLPIALRLGAGAGLVTMAALIALTLASSPAGDRVSAVFDRDAPGGAARVDEWEVGARVVAAHPLVGVGPEGYRVAFGANVDTAYERAHGRDPLPDRVHSGPLDIAVAGGLPALVLWLVLVGFVGRAALRSMRAGRPALAGVACGLVAHAGTQLFLFPLAEVEPIAWLFAGLVVAGQSRLSARDPRDSRDWSDSGAGVRMWVAPRLAAPALAVLAVAALAVGVLDVVADREGAAALHALERGDRRAAVDHAERATRLRPDVVRLRLLEARVTVDADLGIEAGLAAVDAALDLSPGDPVARLDRAELLVARARATLLPRHAAEARAEIERLVALDPRSAALWLQAGAAAAATGDAATAEAAWLRAEELAPASPAPAINLALLYLEGGRLDDAREAADRAGRVAPGDPRATEVRHLVDRSS